MALYTIIVECCQCEQLVVMTTADTSETPIFVLPQTCPCCEEQAASELPAAQGLN